MKKKLKILFFVLTPFLAFFMASFIKFAYVVSRPVDIPKDLKVDAIVTLTGGSERIKTAIDLLEEGYAEKLFISGVNKNVNLDEILKQIEIKHKTIHSKIFIGKEANDTKGNAKETSKWILDNNIKTIILVTSFYHMPRSYFEFNKALPKIIIYKYPVFSENLGFKKFWEWSRAKSVIFVEYFKYITVKVQHLFV